MGSRVLQTMECDRCHATDEGPDDYWPRGWQKVRIGDGKIGLPMFVVCDSCYQGLRAYLQRIDGLGADGTMEP